MNIANWIWRAGLSHPSLPAVIKGDRVALDYGALAKRTARLAGGLRAAGLKPGDRVAVVAKNCVEYVELLHGIWHAGLAAVPANAKLHGRELGYILEHSGARVCLASPGLDTEIAAHAPKSLERLITIGGKEYEALLAADGMPVAEVGGDALAWLFYTSGTTGRPKGAMLTHRNLMQATFAYLTEVDPTSPGDTIIHAAPMSHGSGLYMMGNLALGSAQIIPESGGFEPDEVFAAVDQWRNTSMFAAPTMIKRLVEAPSGCDPANIRTIIWGGAPMYVEDVLRALDRFGPRFAQIYGQGESPMTISVLGKAEIARDHPQWRERLGSAGRPYACVEVRVADDDDSELPAGKTGEILVRGDVVMAGYWQNPEASAQALRNGWLHTGDVGAFDEAGYLSLKDRSKDVIISGGSNIYPREVEEVLLKHANVREVSVIGRADPEWGEVVVAYVVGEAGPAELDSLCLAEIARFKRPKDYVFVQALPKNNYGKILKTELRERDAAREKTRA